MSRKIAYVQAFNEAVRGEMEADPDVFCAGEDIGAFGGVFGTFAGLQKTFGEERIFDTPISEQAIIGLGVGAAVSGLKPIVDLMFMDFIMVAMDQIANQHIRSRQRSVPGVEPFGLKQRRNDSLHFENFFLQALPVFLVLQKLQRQSHS